MPYPTTTGSTNGPIPAPWRFEGGFKPRPIRIAGEVPSDWENQIVRDRLPAAAPSVFRLEWI